MEDVYTIKVKTKPDTRNLYPSERRYSASTVSGLAWVHIALASTSLLLACLALVNPNIENNYSNTMEVKNLTDNDFNSTVIESSTVDYGYILIIVPTLITIFGLAAGLASIMASVRWYIDRNITWLFVLSCLSTAVSLLSFILVAVWFVASSDGNISEFYKDQIPFKDILVVKHSDVIGKNESHILVAFNSTGDNKAIPEPSHLFTNRVLSINILIAAFLELLWSILSVKISYKGMKSTYKDDNNERRGNCISVVTTIKGNNTKNLPRNIKLLPPKADLIDYPRKKFKRMFLAQNDNGYYLKKQDIKTKQNTETSSEFYKERMLSFLNRCASQDGTWNPERTPSVQSEILNPIPEVTSVEINQDIPKNDRVTPLSWGDTPDHTIYNQNNLNLEQIFKFVKKEADDESVENKT